MMLEKKRGNSPDPVVGNLLDGLLLTKNERTPGGIRKIPVISHLGRDQLDDLADLKIFARSNRNVTRLTGEADSEAAKGE
jgi:hypothetical protein